MRTNHRFFLRKEEDRIVDELNPTLEAYGFRDDDEMCLRERVLCSRLHALVDALIVNHNPMAKLPNGEEYQPLRREPLHLLVCVQSDQSIPPKYAGSRVINPAQIQRRTQTRKDRMAGLYVTVAVH